MFCLRKVNHKKNKLKTVAFFKNSLIFVFQDHTILVGCNQGHIVQVSVPEKPQNYTTITYILKLEPKYQRFQTYKAQILRDIKIKEIETRKAIKREQKRKEMEKIIADNPGLEVDEEVFLGLSVLHQTNHR